MSSQYPPQGPHENNGNSQEPQQPFYGNNPQKPYNSQPPYPYQQPPTQYNPQPPYPYQQPPTQYNPQPPYPYQQPPTQYNPQQMPAIPPQYPYPQQTQQSQYQQQPQGSQNKKRKTVKEQWNSGLSGKCGVIAACAILLLVVFACSGIMHAATSGSQVAATTQDTPVATAQPTTASKPAVVPTAQPKPTAKPAPTQSPAQIEATYKASTTDTDVASLDKDGNADMGNEEHFTCTLVAFVKDSSGNTAGANVTDTGGTSSAFVQVAFTPGTDITQLNTQDVIEVWGTNMGVSSGSNAFGATVQEVVVQAKYLSDTTTGYKADF